MNTAKSVPEFFTNRLANANIGEILCLSGSSSEECKRQFTVDSYRQFFLDAGYPDVKVSLADGRIPCAVAVMRKASK